MSLHVLGIPDSLIPLHGKTLSGGANEMLRTDIYQLSTTVVGLGRTSAAIGINKAFANDAMP